MRPEFLGETMRRQEVSLLPTPVHPKGWPRPKGYSYGFVAEGRIVFIAGMVGWNRKGVFESDDLVGQARQALLNIIEVLEEAGGRKEHIVRLTWYVTNMEEYLQRLGELGEAYRSLMGNHYPTMSVIGVSSLVEKRARVEIEATAVIPNREEESVERRSGAFEGGEGDAEDESGLG